MEAENPESKKACDEALNEIKDRAVMLSMAGEYLCEDAFLEKIGSIIEQKIEVVREHVKGLEDQSIGKPAEELNLDEGIEDIAGSAVLMKKADKHLNDQCVKGQLGRDIVEKTLKLGKDVRKLGERIEGSGVSYTTADSVKGFLGRVKSSFDPILVSSALAGKIFLALVFLVAVAFTYLFFTMETENDVIKKIEQCNKHIREMQASLVPVDDELTAIREEIDLLGDRNLDRQGDIKMMDLNVKAYELSEKKEKAHVAINIQQEILAENKKKLDDLKKKSFLQRLLRR